MSTASKLCYMKAQNVSTLNLGTHPLARSGSRSVEKPRQLVQVIIDFSDGVRSAFTSQNQSLKLTTCVTTRLVEIPVQQSAKKDLLRFHPRVDLANRVFSEMVQLEVR